MLITTKAMKIKYEKIQNYLMALIPEKWDAIYLYASVGAIEPSMQNGELYFYYLPKAKGILKKRPINVYEVPNRFNISEDQYLSVVEKLYNCIKALKQDFVNTDQKLWTNVTISMINCKFKIEYSYDKIPESEEECNAKRIIWRYENLGIGGEKKEEKKILDEYFSNQLYDEHEVYESIVYAKNENTAVMFDKENINQKETILYEKENSEEDNDLEDEKNQDNENNTDIIKEKVDSQVEKNDKNVINQILNM